MKCLHLLLVIFLLSALISCQLQSPDTNNSEFTGTAEAVERAESMFAAIGGKAKWASLRSLYIKALHTEPELDNPYVSEIWRSIDAFKVRIEQQNQDFHNVGIFSDSGGWVAYLHRDTTRRLSQSSLDTWKWDHEHNVYVMLNRLARAGSFQVGIDERDRLVFQKQDNFLCAVLLDDQNRPFRFIIKDREGNEQESEFKVWRTTDGFVHSAGGGPVDGNFSYQTEIWEPSYTAFVETYDFGMNLNATEVFDDLSWLIGTWRNVQQDRNHYEYWKQTAAGFEGMGFWLTGNDTALKEELRIVVENDQLLYIPAVSNQNEGKPIPFQWALSYQNRVVFSNLQHDFPNYISYVQSSADTMRVMVYGKDGGRRLRFVFERME